MSCRRERRGALGAGQPAVDSGQGGTLPLCCGKAGVTQLVVGIVCVVAGPRTSA
jgi:hypothetical protein